MKYFLDSSFIIDYLNNEPIATEKMTFVLTNDDDCEFVINRLVYLECLRTIPLRNSRKFQESKNTLETFKIVEIKPKIYEQAIELSRFCQKKGITLKGKCAAIDFLHFITAKYYQLALLAHDGDMEKLATVYDEWKNTQESFL